VAEDNHLDHQNPNSGREEIEHLQFRGQNKRYGQQGVAYPNASHADQKGFCPSLAELQRQALGNQNEIEDAEQRAEDQAF